MNTKTAIELCDNAIPLYLPIYVNDRENVQQKLAEKNIYALFYGRSGNRF